MNCNFKRKLPIPKEIKAQYPVSLELAEVKARRDEEIKRMAEWIASLRDSGGNEIGMNIPLHITRFFPRFHMTDRNATDIDLIYRLADLCREYLNFVYTGNC